jgi:concanavalin A-like lectin/glucanase superfamily protein
MAYSFDGTNDTVALADDPALSLPDSDWTIGGWIKIDNVAGGSFKGFVSWGTWGQDPSINWLVPETGQSPAGGVKWRIDDAGGDTHEATSSPGVLDDAGWHHVVLSRSGTTVTQYIDGGAAAGSASNANVDGVDRSSTAWTFGNRVGATNFFDGDMEDFFKVDRALSGAERSALAAGFSSRLVVPDAAWRFVMDGAYEEAVGLAVTVSGATLVEGQLLQQPAPPLVVTAPAAAVLSTTRLALMGVG